MKFYQDSNQIFKAKHKRHTKGKQIVPAIEEEIDVQKKIKRKLERSKEREESKKKLLSTMNTKQKKQEVKRKDLNDPVTRQRTLEELNKKEQKILNEMKQLLVKNRLCIEID